jgi:glutamine synthetase
MRPIEMVSAARADGNEVAEFLRVHPDTEAVDAFVIDANGHALGKRIPIEDLASLADTGVQFSACALLADVRGLGHGAAGLGTEDGDPDATGWPMPGTLAPVPWARRPTAQVQLQMRDVTKHEPLWWDPRVLLDSIVQRLRADGLHPVIACELEFYLVDPKSAQAPGEALVPAGTHGRPQRAVNLSVDAIEQDGELLDAMRAAGLAQRLPVASAVAEYGIGQFEINLMHVAEPLQAADHAVLLRRAVQGVARARGLEATFMPKPFLNQPGSGLHVHVSLTDAAGRNLFGAAGGEQLLDQAIGGLQALTADSIGLFAPHFNAHRRFSGPFVPRSTAWGHNNRSVAFRVPVSSAGARRIEHRIAGADASPHLVLAAVLAGLHHGITHKLGAGKAAPGKVRESLPEFSDGLLASLARLEHSQLLAEYLPARYLGAYTHLKRGEYEAMMNTLLPAELAFYR